MALIKCHECNADISDKALACPKCGAPLTQSELGPSKQIISAGTATPPDSKPNSIRIIVAIVVATAVFAAILQAAQKFTRTESIESSLSGSADDAPEIKVSDLQLNQGAIGNFFISGQAINHSTRSFSLVVVEINFFDKSGVIIGSTSSGTSNIGPAQTWKFQAPVLQQEQPATWQVMKISTF